MTEADAARLIATSFPSVWSDLWASRKVPVAFQYSAWTNPGRYVRGATELELIAPGLAGLCPLFERNGEAIIGWLPERDWFVQFYYEGGREGDAAIEVLGHNYQQFLLALCLELEDAGMRDEWLEFADAARFNHSAKLAAALDQDPYDERALDALRDLIGPAAR